MLGLRVGLHFGSKMNTEISIVFEDLSRNSVFFQIEVKLLLGGQGVRVGRKHIFTYFLAKPCSGTCY